MPSSSSVTQPEPEATQGIELPACARKPRDPDFEAPASLHAQSKESNPLVLAPPPCPIICPEHERKMRRTSKSCIVPPPRQRQFMGDVVGLKVPDLVTGWKLPRKSSAHRCFLAAGGDVTVEPQPSSLAGANTKCPVRVPACAGSPTCGPRGENGVLIVSQDDRPAGLVNSRRRYSKESKPAVNGEDGVLLSEYEEDSADAAVRQTVARVRSKNCVLLIVLLVIIIVLAVAGGVGVGFVNKHYTTLTHRMYLESGERIVLNSSVMLLKNYHETLRADARHLLSFVRSSMIGRKPESIAVVQSTLYLPFFEAWSTWLFSSNVPSTHSIYVSMCGEPLANTVDCPFMALTIVCMPNVLQAACFYMHSDEVDRSRMIVNRIEVNESGIPRIGAFYKYVPLKVNYAHYQTNNDYGYFLDQDCAASLDGKVHTTLTIRRQIVVGDLVIICDASGFFERWFQRFEKGLQKKKDSHSVLFVNDGTVLAYDCGAPPRHRHVVSPCSMRLVPHKMGDCMAGKADMIDRIVDTFTVAMQRNKLMKRGGLSKDHVALTERVGDYIVVYQDFLSFRVGDGEPKTVFIAAYAVPLDTSLGRDGFVQISICVVIIIICMFLLGGVAMVAVNQMMRVVEVISQLSTHAATYDTKRMRSVLDRQKPGMLARVITSADIINCEFQHILTNLNAYRPFLPQSLLTKSSYSFSDEPLEPPSLWRSDVALGGSAADDVVVDEDGVPAKPLPRFHLKNTLEGSVSNPVENWRLLQRGFHRTKSTILVVSLSNVALDAGESVDAVNLFVQTVLNHAAIANGVVEVIEFQKIVVSFNSHFPVPRHQEKACLCALAIREEFRDRGCSISIGIASGYNYVGTTGTEQQKARVIMGESVVVAQSLTSLKNYLGCSILATDQVVFEALVTAVAVDVVQLYYEHNHQWVQYGVSEIIGNRYAVLSPDMQLVKSVFKLVRYRQAEEALEAVRRYVDAAAERRETPSWPVRRIHALVERQQLLIRSGYRRQRLQWQALEGDEIIMKHLSEENQSYNSKRQPRLMATVSTATVDSLATLSTHAKAAPCEFGFVSGDVLNAGSEAELARALVGEQSKLSMTRRQLAPIPSSCFSEDALFPVFTVKSSDGDEEERSPGSSRLSSQHNRVTDGNAEASGADSEEMRPVLLVEPQTLRSEERHDVRIGALLPPFTVTTSSPFLPAHDMEYPCTTAGISSMLSNSRRHSALDRQRHIAPTPLHDGTCHASTYATSGALGGVSGGKSSIGASLATTSAGNLGRTADSALKQSSENVAGLAKMHCSYKLPQRIVSVNGQVFHRTSQLVGRGSFGEVYVAISETGSLGAMKVFPLNDNNAPQLIREVETLSQMRHENIVGYDCCAVQDNFFFIICEYLAAGTLGSLIQKLGVIPERAARKYACDMLFGLGYLHQHSWLHCDIKPENILVTSDGTCKLADFGAASLGRSLTDAVSVRGTPRFSAPEAILGTWNQQADIYSFGITVAQMVTGVHPWHKYTEPDHLFVAHYAGEIRHSLQTGMPCAMQPDLPTNLQDKELESAIHRCCEFDPARRPTAEELVTLLS
ncbi:mitogen-activated protein kinase-like protein [Leishmania infantum JPCM5]|uniref:Mitogen-activated protein kinase-like protein n=2 Tax=Leishmania infantum TaxID=5671 RepID=A4ICP3_LEIIN|nr:mitogen-activated protein kinase-like protein [Leishmania infantum JPCM5]CAC9549198.1 mitogen-activated_protein_kinase-like_protein [Leishmania infantum]CAM72621.1 mitogen-activated protein kinase-like protein [Leishmania infantum JPCM5]SUZ46468.1 mitogen-activated_protein_kinase-like_protein [Leishmania infantum]|eukprot:XP_001469512.1 mitogen-activated protein kinase-like protein [Leishmania infantum JPCM5]